MVEVLRVAILNFRESLSVIYNALVHDEIESSHVLSMRDMVSLQRLKLPCRSICCNHIPCFELEVYKSINKSKPLHTYKCPVCNNSCPPKTLYIDSVTLCLSELLPSEDKVLLLPDGTFSLGEKSRKRKADCIDLTGSDDEDQSGDADTVNYLAQLQQVLQKKWGSNRTTSFAELTPKQSSGIADVVQLMNSDQFTSAIRNNIFNFTVQTSLIARLPFHVVTDERLLIKQLTNIKGVGKVTAERIIKFYKEKLNEENNSVSAQPVSQIAIPWMDSAAPVPESQNSLVSLYVKRIHPIAASTMVPTSSTSGQNQAYSGVQDVRAIPNRSETSKTLPVASNLGATVYNTAFSTAKFTGQETLASVLGNNSTPSVGSSSLVNSLSASADSGQVAAVISVSATNTAAGGARATIPIDGSSAASNDTSPSKALRRLVPNNQLAGRANVVDLTLEDSPVLAERHAGNSSDTDLLDSDTDNANFRNRRMRIVDSESPRSSSGFFSGTVANNGSIDKFSSVPSSLSGLNIHNPVNNKDQNQRTDSAISTNPESFNYRSGALSDGTAVSAINDSSSTPSVTVGSFASSVLPTSNVEAESGTSNEPASADERFNASSYSIVDGGDRRNESNSIVNNNSSNNSGYSNDVSDSKNDNNFSEQPYGNSIPTYNSNCDRSVQPSSQLGLPPISSNGNNIYKEASASTNIWTNEKRLLPPPPAKIVETTTQQQQPAAGKNTMVDLIVNDFLDN